jgi:hypothetical protein
LITQVGAQASELCIVFNNLCVEAAEAAVWQKLADDGSIARKTWTQKGSGEADRAEQVRAG